MDDDVTVFAESPLSVFRDKTFRGETIRLDGRAFANCIFEQCVLEFGGLEDVSLVENDFRNCRFAFVGAAAAALRFLSALYRDGAVGIVEATFDDIRKGHVE